MKTVDCHANLCTLTYEIRKIINFVRYEATIEIGICLCGYNTNTYNTVLVYRLVPYLCINKGYSLR
jgi:hypothetical protein